MKNGMYVAWTTVGSEAEAAVLASLLVEEGLAACVQIDGPVRSFYRWRGKTESATECRLWIKCTVERIGAVEARVREAHPYEVPQWVALLADRVDPEYARWAHGE